MRLTYANAIIACVFGFLGASASAAVPQPIPPAAPSALEATSFTSSSIQLMWENNSSARGIVIERRTTASFGEIARIGGSSTLYFDTGLVTGTTYTYRVRAFNRRGQQYAYSAYSNEASAAPIGIPTPTPTPTFTVAPPTVTQTPTVTVPTPTSTPTVSGPTPVPSFGPLVRHPEVICPAGETNWYGEGCRKVLIFGHDRIGQATQNLITRNKGPLPCGAAIDESVTPNRVYLAVCGHSRVLGFSSLGICSNGAPCTWNEDCPAPDMCVRNPLREADLQIPTTDVKDGACNSDSNIGLHGPAGRDRLCLFNQPDNSNLAESFYSLPIEVDAQGNLYVPDRYNERLVRYDRPFATDTFADFCWGQPDCTSNVPQEHAKPTATSVKLNPAPHRRHGPGSGAISVAPDGGVWISDIGNSRVVHASPGTKTWDVCLGQDSCTSYRDESVCNSTPTDVPLPLSVICKPVAARIKPSTGELYVFDAGRFGWSGHYVGRIMVFTPPFATGMSATRAFAPQITTLTQNDGTTVPYWVRGYDFRFAEHGQGDVILVDDGDNNMLRNRALVLDTNGIVLDVIGSVAPDRTAGSWPSGCGDPLQRWYWWGGGGFDVAGPNLVAPAIVGNVFTYYRLPADNWIATTGNTCPPLPTSGLFDNTTFWGRESADTLKAVNRAIGANGQLIVGTPQEPGSTRVWNDYVTRGMGSPADVSRSFMGNQGNNFSHMASDGTRIWWTDASKNFGRLWAAGLPLTALSTKLNASDGKLYWADTDAEITQFSAADPPNNHVAYDYKRDRLLIAMPLMGAILGVSNYRDVDSGGKLLVDWVWGAPDRDHFHECNQGLSAPTARTLCSGGPLALSPGGDLWIAEIAARSWDQFCGNNRVLGLLSADLDASAPTPGTVTFAQFDAKRIIAQGRGFTTPGPCGVYQATTLAVDNQGRLWVSGGSNSGASALEGAGIVGAPKYWRLLVYADPLNKQTPDAYVRLPGGYVPDVQADWATGKIIVSSFSTAEVVVIDPEADPDWLVPIE